MNITSVIPLKIIDGVGNTIDIVIGTRAYRLDHKNPVVAEQLRIHRKHGRISFNELLPCDIAVGDATEGKAADKVAAMKAAANLKPSPVGKKVKGEKNVRKSPQPAPTTQPKKGRDKSDGKVSE